MAPDVALSKIQDLTTDGSVVLDPMCGSGTVPRLALEAHRQVIACDLDPLAVLITRVACKPEWSESLPSRARDLITAAKRLRKSTPEWIESDQETEHFTKFWFAEQQRGQLGRIARVLSGRPTSDDPLRIALSRLIITKDRGASLARDTSHSRPHRVRTLNDFDVYQELVASAARVEKVTAWSEPTRKASIRTMDARKLSFIEDQAVDLTLTSPPYLNAIDYLRGHRLSLVWLGWQLRDLRELRAATFGTEKAVSHAPQGAIELASKAAPLGTNLPLRQQRMIWRFCKDMEDLAHSIARVTKKNGHLVLVVADSLLKGVPISNSQICQLAAESHSFELKDEATRAIPAQHRYLPPPNGTEDALAGRMREEKVLTFRKTA